MVQLVMVLLIMVLLVMVLLVMVLLVTLFRIVLQNYSVAVTLNKFLFNVLHLFPQSNNLIGSLKKENLFDLKRPSDEIFHTLFCPTELQLTNFELRGNFRMES